jgi:hypothetical protein
MEPKVVFCPFAPAFWLFTVAPAPPAPIVTK